jgi:hypothetical protein
MDGVLGLAQSDFKFALHLLGNAFNLEGRIARPFAHLSLGASDYFVDSAFNSIALHRPSSAV